MTKTNSGENRKRWLFEMQCPDCRTKKVFNAPPTEKYYLVGCRKCGWKREVKADTLKQLTIK